jgi:hypothetical protein
MYLIEMVSREEWKDKWKVKREKGKSVLRMLQSIEQGTSCRTTCES